MIVDDSEMMRNEIAHMLKGTHFEIVCTADNSKHAIELYPSYKPDIVTMDLTMLARDGSYDGGLEAIQSIIENYPEASILVISAMTDFDTGLEALGLGAEGFLEKPLLRSKLLTALYEMLGIDTETLDLDNDANDILN